MKRRFCKVLLLGWVSFSIGTVSNHTFAQSVADLPSGVDIDATTSDPIEQDVSFWLEKMNRALHDESYEGTFIYMRGKRFDTIEVAHHVADGVEFERMTNLTGEEREIIRINDQADCYHARGKNVSLVHDVPMGPFSHNFSRNITNNQSSYNISLHGKGRIAGRTTVRVSISPRNNDRYGYRLWLDEKTGLLLKSDLVDRGRVLELFQFTEVVIGEPIEKARLVSSLTDVGRSHSLSRHSHQVAQTSQQVAKPQWRVSWVPPGFKQVKSPVANSMLFTDGVASVSVFVERVGNSTMGDMQTSLGGTVVLTRTIKSSSQQITVVGEVPLDTAKRVAESIEPVIY